MAVQGDSSVQQKKVSFNFFPLPENPKRMAVFSAKPSSVFALGVTDHLRSDSSDDLRVALAHAILHLKSQGKKVGADAPRYTEHGVEQLNEADVEYEEFEEMIARTQQDAKKQGKKKEVEPPKEEEPLDEEEGSPSTHEENEQKPSIDNNGTKSKGLKRGAKKEENESTPKRGKAAPMKETQEVHDSTIKTENKSKPTEPSPSSGGELDAEQRAPKKRGKMRNGPLKAVVPMDEIYEVANREHKKIVSDLMNNPSKEMLEYVIPTRNSMIIQFKTANLITDEQADLLFDMVMRHYMTIHKTAQILPAVHYVATLLIEPLIKRAAVKTGKFTAEEVAAKFEEKNKMTNGEVKGAEKRHRMSDPLEDLVRVACQELDKMNGTA